MDYITAFIEVPKGSRNKYEYNHETGRIFLDRMLFPRSSIQPTMVLSRRPWPRMEMNWISWSWPGSLLSPAVI